MNFNEVCTLTMGQSPDSSTYNTQQIGLPFYQGNADFGKINPTPRVWCFSPKKVAQKDDILISVRAPIGDLNIAIEECGIGRGLACIHINDKNQCDLTYLFHFLLSKAQFLQEKGTGSTFKAINKDSLLGLVIPIPSIEEQNIISNDLIAVHKLIDWKKSQLIALDELVKSRFIEMFGNVKTFKPLMELTSKITDGSHNPPKGIEFSEYLMLSSQNIHDELTLKDVRYLSKEDFEIENRRTNIEDGDVLLTIVGTIGRTYVVKNGEKYTFQRSVGVIKPKQDILNGVFLSIYLKTPQAIVQLEASGHGTSQKGIYLNDIKKLIVPIVDIGLQNEFADFVKLIDKSKFVYLSIQDTSYVNFLHFHHQP